MNNAFRVSALFYHRNPLAVARFIVTVYVDSLYRITGWTLAHVSQKVAEVAPAIADGDTTAAVMFKALIARVCAAFDNPTPTAIRAGLVSAWSASMFCAAASYRIDLETPARFGVTRTKFADTYLRTIATVAKTLPNDAIGAALRSCMKCNQPVKPLPGDVNRFWHTLLLRMKTLLNGVSGGPSKQNGFREQPLATAY